MLMLELLNKASKWGQGSLAYNKRGDMVNENSPEAVKWCLLGAAKKCYGTDNRERAKVWDKLYESLTKLYPRETSLITFNDSDRCKYRDVRKLLKDAQV